MKTHPTSAVASLVVLVSMGTAGVALAAPYRFDLLHEAAFAPGGSRVTGPPAINDNGTAAFVLRAGSGDLTLHVATPGAVREVPTTGVPNLGGVAINNHDLVAFVGIPPGARSEFDYSAYVVSPGGIPRVVINRLGMYGDIVRELGISDDGRVIGTIFALNAPLDSVIIGDGTTTTEIYRAIGHLGSPRMSSSGDWGFAFESDQTTSGGFQTNRIRVENVASSFALPGETIWHYLTAVRGGDVANHWAVFSASVDNGPRQLLKAHDSTVVPVAGAQGLTGTAAVNDDGTVAVWHGAGTAADPDRLEVFHGAGPELVLAQGDALFGSTVSRIYFSQKGFNNLEQLAFLAHLADGRDVYVLASPVPEPGGMVALVVGAGVLVRRRRWGVGGCASGRYISV